MSKIRNENKLMSILSIWGILLVVLGHSGFEEEIIQQHLHYLHSWIYSFHMPLFFLVSGFLYSLTNTDFLEIKPLSFLKKKAVRLLIPYLILGVVLFCIKFAFSNLSHASRVFSVTSFFAMFINTGYPGSTMGYLWYVFTLFMIFVVVSLFGIFKINLKNSIICISLIFVFWSAYYLLPNTGWMNISMVCRYIPYFLAGILFERHKNVIDKALQGGASIVILLIATLLTLLLTFNSLSCPKYFIEPLRAIVGIIMSVELCAVLLKSNWVNNKILPYSKYTYSIYLLSWFGQYAVKILFVNL